jgi:hypothetical protein
MPAYFVEAGLEVGQRTCSLLRPSSVLRGISGEEPSRATGEAENHVLASWCDAGKEEGAMAMTQLLKPWLQPLPAPPLRP